MTLADTHRRRRSGRRALCVLSFLAAASLRAQVLDWEEALPDGGSGNSFFTAVEGIPEMGAGGTDAALLCGHFSGIFMFDGLPLSNPIGQDGVVARLQRIPGGPDWEVVWLAHANSNLGNVRVNDLVLDDTGRFFVTGTFSEDVTFLGVPTLNAPGATEGFVAGGSALTGAWSFAYVVNGMEPVALALDPEGRVYLTGPGSLARRYPAGGAGGAPDWDVPPPAGTTGYRGIVVDPSSTDPAAYVLSENNSTFREVALNRLNANTGAPVWMSSVGGADADTAGGLGLGPEGDLRVAFSSSGTTINFQSPTGAFDLPDIPPVAATHGLLLRLDPAGELVWSAVLGEARLTSSQMLTRGLSLDAFGNTFVSAQMVGEFLVEAVPRNGNQDAAILGVDPAGTLFDFHQSTGAGLEAPADAGSPRRNFVLTVGSYQGGPSSFGGIPLPGLAPGETRGFFAALRDVPNQNRYIVTPVPGAPGAPTVAELVDNLTALGGQVANVVAFSGVGVAVAVYLTAEQVARLEGDPSLRVEFDLAVQPAGTSNDSGWALEHLNDPTNLGPAPYTYTYAEPGQTVNFYLLDTAVDNGSGWFDANPNLTIAPTTLVRGFGDPLVSSLFQHGTEMLSLVGGPNVGAAVGTPVVVKNFDFYPTGPTTTASLLADAIYQAIDYHLDHTECTPGVILIASSSIAPGGSATITTAVEEAVLEGLTVVVSAGNSNSDAASFVPASSGALDGVLCVGGSTQANAKEPGSNHTAVDCFAPGQGVRVIDFSAPNGGGFGSFTGTSASAALTGTVVATYLSVNPWCTPAALEAALIGAAYPDGGSGLTILQMTATGPDYFLEYGDWASWFGLSDISHGGNDDGDPWNNFEEYFFGLKPVAYDPLVSQTGIVHRPGTNTYEFRFNISAVLLDPDNLGTLRDGTTYEVTHSTDASSFSTAPGKLEVGGSTAVQTELSLENPLVEPTCLLRVEISPASPSP